MSFRTYRQTFSTKDTEYYQKFDRNLRQWNPKKKKRVPKKSWNCSFLNKFSGVMCGTENRGFSLEFMFISNFCYCSVLSQLILNVFAVGNCYYS